MKKTLAILLALMMAGSIALVSCDDERPPVDDGANNGDVDYIEDESTESSTQATTESDSNTETQGSASTGNNGWVEKSGKVYVGVSQLTVRVSPSTEGGTEATVKLGNELTRIATNSNGWTKINYNGKECYVQSKYICDTYSNFDFTDATEPVTLTFVEGEGSLCLYQSPFMIKENGALSFDNIYKSSGFEKVNGTITKIATSKNGWLKVTVTGTLTVAGMDTTYTVENATFYIDPDTAVSSRISDPDRSGSTEDGPVFG